jgi:LysR family hydrogen peroxide-inducible transcriptional activator
VTLLPELAIAVENRTGALSLRTFAAPQPFRTIGLAWRRRSARAATLRAVGRVMTQALRAA